VARTVAVVGGGVAGTASAYALTGRRTPGVEERGAVGDAEGRSAGNARGAHDPGASDEGGGDHSRPAWSGVTVEVDLFETAAALGGRIATRERDGCRYDYGANYVKAPDARFQRVIDDALGADRVPVDGRIRVHDGDGTVREGRDEQADRWTGYGGLDALPTGLADASGATVHTGTHVESLARREDGWLVTVDGDSHRYDAVIVATEPSSVARLLGGAGWDVPLRERVATAADGVPYRTVPSVALHYPFRIERPYYALVNVDGDHRVGWLAREECKPGHVPDGESLLIVQLSPTRALGRPPTPDAAISAAGDAAAALLDDPRLREPDWTDAVLWTAAQPERGVAPDLFERALRHDLGLAGDWVAGTGRTFAALQTGLDAGRRVRQRLEHDR